MPGYGETNEVLTTQPRLFEAPSSQALPFQFKGR